MPQPASFAEQQKAYRAGLWQMAWERAVDPTKAQAEDGLTVCVPVINAGVGAVLVTAVDIIIREFYDWGAVWGKNPACLAQGAWANLKDEIQPAARILLFAALNVLLVSDPTEESSRRHDICRPWDPSITCPSIAITADGAGLRRAGEWVTQTPTIKQPSIELTKAAPDVLSALVLAQVTGDGAPELYGFKLKVRAELGA